MKIKSLIYSKEIQFEDQITYVAAAIDCYLKIKFRCVIETRMPQAKKLPM